MQKKQLLLFLPFLVGLSGLHVVLNFWLFPNLGAPQGEIAKHTYEGIVLGIYSCVGYLVAYFTRESAVNATVPHSQPLRGPAKQVLQGIILALILFVGFQITEAMVNIFITVFDDLRINGEITGATTYGMNVIDHTLSGFLFFFSWLPLCVYTVLRVTRKLSRNPGFVFFLFVSLVVLFSSIFTNYQSSDEWAQALTRTLGPIFGAMPDKIYPRDVWLFLAFQSIATIVLSVILALFMWSVASLRMWLGSKLDRAGV